MNGVIDLVVLNLLLWYWSTTTAIGLFIINSIAYILAVLNSYFWNSRLTFRANAFLTSRVKIKFVIQAAVSLVISNGVFLLFIYLFGRFSLPLWVDQNASKGLSMAVSSTASFFFMKFYVFFRRESTGSNDL
jgi:putative flippase GtrA